MAKEKKGDGAAGYLDTSPLRHTSQWVTTYVLGGLTFYSKSMVRTFI